MEELVGFVVFDREKCEATIANLSVGSRFILST